MIPKKKMKKAYFPLLLLTLTACTAKAPTQFVQDQAKPSIHPDYTDITIPSNIAPINFSIDDEAEKFVTVMKCGDSEFTTKGRTAAVPLRRWRRLLASGDRVDVTVYAYRNGGWKQFTPFTMNVAEPIDPYISYRLIPPGYQCFEQLTINQRDLTSFRTKVIFCNSTIQYDDKHGSCINCHHYRNYKTDNMQFHIRQYKGGTVMVVNGELRKLNLKTDSTISAGVYPAWHPTHDYVAYSTNQTRQAFVMSGKNRIQGYDAFSDLILYDINANEVSIIENSPNDFECYPAWSPDGRTLYYVSAHFPFEVKDGEIRENEMIPYLDQIHYDLYTKPFDPETGTWGRSWKMIDAAAMEKSITLPRVSPDGNYLMFAMGHHGVLHLYNKDADLFLLDLRTGRCRSVAELNSRESESYHSWSSNGKWLIFSSRRENGVVTRPFIAYFKEDGTFTKPFALPQKDPEFSKEFLMAFNIPEFMIEPVKISSHKFARFANRHDAEAVGFRSKREDPALN